MTNPFAQLRRFSGAPPAAPGVIIDSVHCFDRPKNGGLLQGSYMGLPEAALTLGIDEDDLKYYVRTNRVRFTPGKNRVYFFMDHLREDLVALTVPARHSGVPKFAGRQHRGSSGRKTAECAGQI
jgi:hypothetical protein